MVADDKPTSAHRRGNADVTAQPHKANQFAGFKFKYENYLWR